MSARTETPPAQPARKSGPLLYVALVVLPAVAVALVAADHRGWWFRLTGTATYDGCTFRLHAKDNYLTPHVVYKGEYEPTETELIRGILKPGDTFIDVGANVGWYSVLGGKWVGPKGKVVAFEPEPGNLVLLRDNVRRNKLDNVTVVDKGLSKEAGSFKLFLEDNNLGMHSLVMEHHEGKKFINVETVAFDDYWTDKGDIKLIKIDTEGAEGFILDGMRETIKNQKNLELVIEFSPDRLAKAGYDPDKILADLYAAGYRASRIDEEGRKVTPLGTPKTKDIVYYGTDDRVSNLHFKR